MKKLESYYRKHKEQSLYFYPIALLYFKNKEYDKAYQILVEGLKKYPRYALALTLIGKILISEKNYDAALAYLETAVNIQRGNVEALRLLAECYEAIGKIDKAIEIYERLLLLEDRREYKDKLIELASRVDLKEEDIGGILEEIDDKRNEIPEIKLEDEDDGRHQSYDDVSVGDNEDDEEVTITMAKLYEKQGYINDAIEIYKKILKREPDNIEARESLNSLLKASGLSEGEVDEEN